MESNANNSLLVSVANMLKAEDKLPRGKWQILFWFNWLNADHWFDCVVNLSRIFLFHFKTYDWKWFLCSLCRWWICKHFCRFWILVSTGDWLWCWLEKEQCNHFKQPQQTNIIKYKQFSIICILCAVHGKTLIYFLSIYFSWLSLISPRWSCEWFLYLVFIFANTPLKWIEREKNCVTYWQIGARNCWSWCYDWKWFFCRLYYRRICEGLLRFFIHVTLL